MAKTLEKLIKERKKQAKKKKLYEKTRTIASNLGSPREGGYSHDQGWLSLFNYVLPRGDFVASYRRFVSNGSEHEKYSAEICFEGKIVFSESIYYAGFVFISDRSIDAYVPGNWERTLDSLYEEAQKEAARARNVPDEAELKRKFGI